ncbi:MAG: class I SAM-dependent methyltransferase [Candidatus Micrarchaeia archaeon]
MLENKKAKLLNSKAAMDESKAGEVVSSLHIEKGQKVADIGSGGGYFSLLLAEAAGPKGKVYIVDTDQKLLDFASALAKENGVKNIVPVLAQEDSPNLPENGVDLIFMRSVCHHLKGRKEYFSRLRRFLAPGGKIALIDYRRGPFLAFRWLRGHYVEESVIKKEMWDAGFHLEESFDFISRQWFMVFSPVSSIKSP